MNKFRKDFPTINKITYLDSGALVLKPKIVIDAINYYYNEISISPRTSDTPLAIELKNKYNELKEQIAKLTDAKKNEVILTSGTTDSLNYLALMLEDLLLEQDEIILSRLNHSSNIVPWLEIAKRKKARIIYSDDILNDISTKTKIIALSQKSNSFEDDNKINKIKKYIQDKNIILVNDAAQAINSEKVSLKLCDVIAFSSNKIYGPTGMGALIIKENLLKKLKPKKFGGGAIDYIDPNGDWKTKETTLAHEPGTPNLAGIYGFSAALKYFDSLDLKEKNHYLKTLSKYTHKKLQEIPNIKIYSKPGNNIIIFNIQNVASQEVASFLGHRGVYLRSGHFCNSIIAFNNKIDYLRISLEIYNNNKDIDKLCSLLKKGGDFIDFL
ncbi:MAG: aminotransferase class V-fold PLP-dependent enzyme [Metamycoplasmataceae bacterium]